MLSSHELSASLEDYLEAIYRLVKKGRVARGRDISKMIGVSGASVTGALRALSERGLVNYAPYEVVTLTARGERVAADVAGRHRALKEFFVRVLGVDDVEAGENACRIEHAVSENLMDRLIRFAEFVQVCPRAGERWLEHFERYYVCAGSERSPERCRQCMDEAAETTPSEDTEGGA